MNNKNGESGGVGLWKTLAYCSGQFGGNVFNAIVGSFLIFFYTTEHSGHGILVSIGWVGVAQLAGRCVDAFTDLGIGYASDVTKSRWGRRRPYIIVGTPLLTIAFYFLLNPMFPAGSTAMIVYMFVTLGVFWFAFTLTMAPYLALMPEICESSQERVGMSTYMTVFMLLTQIYSGMAAPKIIEHSGYKTLALLSCALGFVFMIIPGIFIKEKTAVEHPDEEKVRFVDAVKWTFSNPAFIVYIVSSTFIYLGFAAVTASLPFIVTLLFEKPLGFMTNVYAVMLGGFVVSFFVVNAMTKRMEKAQLYRWSIIGISVSMPLMYFLGQVDMPFAPWKVGMVVVMLMSLPIAANMVLPMAILADIIDYDEKRTGKRREAIYFGCQGFLQKLATGLSGGMQAFLFSRYGYTEGHHLGVNLLGPAAGVMSLIGYLVFLKYPLDEKTKDIRQKKVA